MVIIIKNEFVLGGTVALLLQDQRTMLPWSVCRLFHDVHYTRKNDCEDRKVLSHIVEMTDKVVQTRGGRKFQTRVAATRKARSPIVVILTTESRTHCSIAPAYMNINHKPYLIPSISMDPGAWCRCLACKHSRYHLVWETVHTNPNPNPNPNPNSLACVSVVVVRSPY